MNQPPLLTPIHPGQAATLVHFCGRGRPAASSGAPEMSAPDRLDSILRDGALRAFPPYGSSWPVVCFSESDTGGVEAMLRIAGWEPWGVVVSRDWAWSQGGGPVWYVRGDVLTDVRPTVGERTGSWFVRTEPQEADWLHEREWRIPSPSPGPSSLRLDSTGLVAVLVGDSHWEPSPVTDIEMNPMTGRLAIAGMTPRVADVPRWYWNGERIQELSPVPARVEYYGDL